MAILQIQVPIGPGLDGLSTTTIDTRKPLAPQISAARFDSPEAHRTFVDSIRTQLNIEGLDLPLLSQLFSDEQLAASTLTPATQAGILAGRGGAEQQQQALIQARDSATAQRRTFLNSEELAMLRGAGVPTNIIQELSKIIFDIETQRVETERLQRVEAERVAVQERQTTAFEALPGRLQSDTGVAALTALGGFPDTQQTALGDTIAPSLLQSIGFALPEGAALGAGLQPQQFFGGGLPTVSQLQNFNQQELGLLSGVVSLGGAGEPFDLRRRAAGVTPLPTGSVAGAAGGLPDIAPQARPRTRRI
jgi:hypothetical protein